MKFNAVLFDLDGTLLDTLSDTGSAMNRALATLGFDPLPLEEYRYRIGWGARVLAQNSLPAETHNDELITRCIGEFEREYRAQPATVTVPYDGVPELLDELALREIPFSIISNKPDALTRLVVRKLLGKYRFSFVQGDRAEVPRKPDPTTALQAAARMNAEPQNILFLGDSDVDMTTARAAAMFPVGAGWGFRSEAELRAAGAQAVIARPLELLSFIHPAER